MPYDFLCASAALREIVVLTIEENQESRSAKTQGRAGVWSNKVSWSN
jgi:hypothetical protein